MNSTLNPYAKPFIAREPKDSYSAFTSYDGRMAFVHSGTHQGKYVYLICNWNQDWLVEFASQNICEHINISDMTPLFDPPAYEA